jgi:hypothetical protein
MRKQWIRVEIDVLRSDLEDMQEWLLGCPQNELMKLKGRVYEAVVKAAKTAEEKSGIVHD